MTRIPNSTPSNAAGSGRSASDRSGSGRSASDRSGSDYSASDHSRGDRPGHPGRLIALLLGLVLLAAGLTGLTGVSGLGSRAAAAPAESTSAAAFPPAGSRLGAGAGLYPRLLQLSHSGWQNGAVLASTVTFDGDSGLGAIFRSDDQGRSFHRIGTVRDPDAVVGRGLCCSTLFELPRRIGHLRAGTLLWSASIGQAVTTGRQMSIRVYASTDHGRTWRYLSTPAVADNTLGLWEPEFSVDSAGALVVFFSDETDQPAHSQLLASARTRDGLHWSSRQPVVAGDDPDARPGMAIVRRLGADRRESHRTTDRSADRVAYLMTYEVCGGDYGCRVHYRTSSDGDHWGDPTDLGPTITAADGQYFEHAPTFTWQPWTSTSRSTSDPTSGSASRPGHRSGRLYLVGQVLMTAAGTPAAGNGSTVLVSDDGPAGPWRAIEAPVDVPDPYDNYCPNYSSPLLALAGPRHATRLLEIASGYDADQVCAAAFGARHL